ncbi:hypothetical protein QAD02_009165 [Eretmocerus hayati]|uniref:Uncharacterized protein n=1 Tax=Eretmocerus hayati TaxID=131215 RepID=A0ACC2N8P2_9HYME|nr:hypothetical protein QAD02_009165 [Eretmocerus hayati]
MDFRFSVNKLLPKRINKITHTLIPEGFRGDRREFNDCQRMLTRILDEMGEASAKAQGLNRTITSALKIRDTDHILYLMVDSEGNNGLGSVVGLLKTGSKSLFMFDENGIHYKLKPRCILDFYIHESRQRMGLGNELYQHMLTEENLKPIKLAIDRPSDKFLAFLMKHYKLTSVVPQNNKFVVFKGFFDDETPDDDPYKTPGSLSPSRPPSRLTSEYKIHSNNNVEGHNVRGNNTNGVSVTRSAYGRYAASRPPCSMATIIHSGVEQPTEHIRSRSLSARMRSKDRQPSLNIFVLDEKKQRSSEDILSSMEKASLDDEPKVENLSFENEQTEEVSDVCETQEFQSSYENELAEMEKIRANGDHVGENISPQNVNLSVCSEEVDSGNQQAGHLDLKFYHSPLW